MVKLLGFMLCVFYHNKEKKAEVFRPIKKWFIQNMKMLKRQDIIKPSTHYRVKIFTFTFVY